MLERGEVLPIFDVAHRRVPVIRRWWCTPSSQESRADVVGIFWCCVLFIFTVIRLTDIAVVRGIRIVGVDGLRIHDGAEWSSRLCGSEGPGKKIPLS